MTAPDLRPLHTAPVSVHPPHDVRNPAQAQADRYAALVEALAGVQLGAHDLRIVEWLAGWDTSTVATLVSLLGRARATGGPR